MNELIIGAGTIIILMAAVGFVFLVLKFRRRPRKLKANQFQARWQEMQKLCASKDNWQQAVIEADSLLEEALKKKGYPGKTTGARLTKAQRDIKNNEGAWFGHKLRTKLDQEPDTKLKEADVKQALIGIRQALKDLGAFSDGKQ